eukprot:g29010.t1
MLAAKEQPSLSPSMQDDALASAIPLHFLEAEIGGLVLCAKTATAAALSARGESAGYSLRRRFRGIFCGAEPAALPDGWTPLRSVPSVRFGRVLEAETETALPAAALRRAAGAGGGARLLGDVEQLRLQEAPEERDFFFADNLEPHATRRKEILKAHPEITKLMGPEWRTKYIVAATVALQILLACLAKKWSVWTFVAVAYVVGATVNHSLFLAIHELAHNLGAKSSSANKIIGMVANLPIVFPYCITFKPYHMAHHRNQGVDGIDTDVPTFLEGYLITKSSYNRVDHTIRKAIFMFFQIFAYALRPMFIKPDLVPFDGWVLCNLLAARPGSGFWTDFDATEETYSYYGPLNWLAYNVGYHNEHHDFPNIAWSNLPKVRDIAPEFYDHLPQCKSWPGAILRYIFDDSISPFSRVKRTKKYD